MEVIFTVIMVGFLLVKSVMINVIWTRLVLDCFELNHELTYDLTSVEYKWSCFSVEIPVRGGCNRLLRRIKLKSMKTILSLEIHCQMYPLTPVMCNQQKL